VVQVRAGEAERATIAGKKNHRVPTEILATVVAARLPAGNEHSQVTRSGIRGGIHQEHLPTIDSDG
jgi:hypothetical protein